MDTEHPVRIRYGANLPHWRQDQATYFVTFHLGDSLPRAVLDAWIAEREQLLRAMRCSGRLLTATEALRLDELHSARVESYLDAGQGECWLKIPAAAEIVASALTFFAGLRYELRAWCVMPNHVHVVVRPLPSWELEQILHSWKSFTAKAVNREVGRTGTLWQAEYYDHLVRDQDDLLRCMEYTWTNPERAGLTDWHWRWIDHEYLEQL
jgi:REP element-mobilizing transposase RayT